MKLLFYYNWQVRDEWFTLLEKAPAEELTGQRTGGHKSILENLFHIIQIEWRWLRGLQGIPEEPLSFENYNTLEKLRQLSRTSRPEIENYLKTLGPGWESTIFAGEWQGHHFSFTLEEVLSHTVAHEIHHIGQLSVWAREIGLEPVSSNVIYRGLTDLPKK